MQSRREYQAGLEARRRDQRRRALLWGIIGLGLAAAVVLVVMLALGF